MTLSFSTKWPDRMGVLAGQSNHFVEKIWKGLSEKDFKIVDQCFEGYFINHHYGFSNIVNHFPKFHTIRHDPHNRWKPGMKMHPVINNRTKNRFQFAPVLECVSVQEIEIKPALVRHAHYNTPTYPFTHRVYIDGVLLDHDKAKILALNDGFPSVEAFFQYFNEDFKGKIIHWTNFTKY